MNKILTTHEIMQMQTKNFKQNESDEKLKEKLNK